MTYIFPFIWLLGFEISIGEMTTRFKGNHKDKKRIAYNAEGDGFQADALCQDGFTYHIFIRNDPAPPKYVYQGLSPLHTRVTAQLYTLKYMYHCFTMRKLYNSTSFCSSAYNHEKKILGQGITKKVCMILLSPLYKRKKKVWSDLFMWYVKCSCVRRGEHNP